MATWIRQGTGTAPTATDNDLVGQYALDNATAPGDFDPTAVNSVRTQWTITGSGFNDDSWDNGACALVGGVSSTEISQHPSTGGTGLQNESEASDHTDSTGIPTGLTTADWEAAFVRGDGTAIPNEWTLWNKVMGPDGSTMAVSVLTVTIDYTPAAAAFEGQASASLALGASGVGGFAASGTASASISLSASAQGDVDYSGAAAAALALGASGTGEFLEYAIFRRTPQTGAAFDPDADTPIVEVVTSPYVDESLAQADYDYQVFRRTASGWSSGSNIEQVSVGAATPEGQGSASLALGASGTGDVEYSGSASASLALSASGQGDVDYAGTASASLALSASGQGDVDYSGTAAADLALSASGAGNFEAPGFNGQASASLALGASGTGTHDPPQFNTTASASLALTTDATGQFVPPGFNGQGSAGLALSASATGQVEYAGTGTADLVLTASAEGQGVYYGTATASMDLGASAQGNAGAPQFNGQGSADLTLTASGQGDHDAPQFNGTGSSDLALSSSGTGQFVPAGFEGQASASFTLDASGTGAFDATWDGTGTASLELTASASGAAQFGGAGQAAFALTAVAFGTEGVLQFIRIESDGATATLVNSDSAVTGVESDGLVGSGIEGA